MVSFKRVTVRPVVDALGWLLELDNFARAADLAVKLLGIIVILAAAGFLLRANVELDAITLSHEIDTKKVDDAYQNSSIPAAVTQIAQSYNREVELPPQLVRSTEQGRRRAVAAGIEASRAAARGAAEERPPQDPALTIVVPGAEAWDAASVPYLCSTDAAAVLTAFTGNADGDCQQLDLPGWVHSVAAHLDGEELTHALRVFAKAERQVLRVDVRNTGRGVARNLVVDAPDGFALTNTEKADQLRLQPGASHQVTFTAPPSTALTPDAMIDVVAATDASVGLTGTPLYAVTGSLTVLWLVVIGRGAITRSSRARKHHVEGIL